VYDPLNEQVSEFGGYVKPVTTHAPDPRQELLWQFAAHVNNTDGLPAAAWGVRAGELLQALKKLDGQDYARRVRADDQPDNPKYRNNYNVFVSGRYANRKRAAAFTDKLCELDAAKVPCRWFMHDRDDDQLDVTERLTLSTWIRNAVRDCDFLVHLHEGVPQRGGNLVELGMALAFKKTVVAVVQPGESGVFHELPQVVRVATDDEAIALLHRMISRKVSPSPAARGVVVTDQPVGPFTDWVDTRHASFPGSQGDQPGNATPLESFREIQKMGEVHHQRLLHNLLAVIFRDGGHTAGEIGDDQTAVETAIEEIGRTRQEHDRRGDNLNELYAMVLNGKNASVPVEKAHKLVVQQLRTLINRTRYTPQSRKKK
jgi:hypothetical protein